MGVAAVLNFLSNMSKGIPSPRRWKGSVSLRKRKSILSHCGENVQSRLRRGGGDLVALSLIEAECVGDGLGGFGKAAVGVQDGREIEQCVAVEVNEVGSLR